MYTAEGAAALGPLFGNESPDCRSKFIDLQPLGFYHLGEVAKCAAGEGPPSSSIIILSNADTNKALLDTNIISREQPNDIFTLTFLFYCNIYQNGVESIAISSNISRVLH